MPILVTMHNDIRAAHFLPSKTYQWRNCQKRSISGWISCELYKQTYPGTRIVGPKANTDRVDQIGTRVDRVTNGWIYKVLRTSRRLNDRKHVAMLQTLKALKTLKQNRR